MKRTTLVILSASAAFVAASCIDPIDVPPCTPQTVTVASTQVDTVTTNTGLRYIDTSVGTGNAADWCHNMAIQYHAFLSDGTEFDSSTATSPLIFAPGIGGLIDGIEQGVIGMKEGGTRRLIIPPSLGFGAEDRKDANGAVIVPGNSTVIYDIGLVQVAR